MGSESIIKISRRQIGKIARLGPGKSHQVQVKTRYTAHMLEVADVHFHHDSAVLLPDYTAQYPDGSGASNEEHVTAFDVAAACFTHAQEHPDQRALVVGHTDRSGDNQYNLALSRLRASNVLYFLQGRRDEWVASAQQKSKVEDYQQILLWLTHSVGWSCDPGGKTNVHDAPTRQAVQDFQEQYNQRFSASIDTDGKVGPQTWGAFFDTYQQELMRVLGTDETGLAEARARFQLLPCESIGCGEEFPITEDRRENYEHPVDRRVEILFFDPGEEPEVDCRLPRGACTELYTRRMYEVTPIPLDPAPTNRTAVRVLLQLGFKHPEGTTPEPLFPEGTPVTVQYEDGTQEQHNLQAEGKLRFWATRAKRSFTLRFETADRWIVVGAAGSANRFVPTADVAALLADPQQKVFKLPVAWSLADTDWAVTGASTYDASGRSFTRLDDMSVSAIGSPATPGKMILDPHWQYLRFVYYDRWIRPVDRLSIPAIMVEGFRRAAASSGLADTSSNWATDPGGVQCLPWILQTPPKPDREVLLRFRMAPNTYIESTGTASSNSRRFVSRSGGAPRSPDPGINTGQTVRFDPLTPSAQRLAYYDLPEVWKSRTYFARIPGANPTDPPAHQGLFEDVAQQATTLSQPLVFSLDDIVLCAGDEAGTMGRPITWDGATQRLAVFCNTFDQKDAAGTAQTTTLSPIGLYKPDTAGKEPYHSEKVPMTATRTDRIAYIADYPNWPRLVIADGNFFDVFDKRTLDGATGVVGARAGVRFLDFFSAANAFVAPGSNKPGTRRQPTRTNFATIQPLYDQRHHAWWGSSRTADRDIGRSDILLLRCCDVDPDGVTERAAFLNYFRFFINFAHTPPAKETNWRALGLTGNAARDWIAQALSQLVLRWNGPQQTGAFLHNPGKALIVPAAASGLKLKVASYWFAQQTARNRAHYDIGVYRHTTPGRTARAFMSAATGDGALDQSENQPNYAPGMDGWFTFAHEVGHGGSLGDEYVEQTWPVNDPAGNTVPGTLPGFDSFLPGAPYVVDTNGMMSSNQDIRARYYWHTAEWLRDLSGNRHEYEVHQETTGYSPPRPTFVFKLPHHAGAPGKSHVNWPVAEEIMKERGPHGRFDVIFYPLGQEHFSQVALPNVVGRPLIPFDGLFVVVVKMKFNFDVRNSRTIHTWLSDVHRQLGLRFNRKYFAAGTVGGQAYGRCLIHFSPRYWASNYTSEDPSDTDYHIRIDVPDTGRPEWDSGLVFVNKHLLEFPRNQAANVFAEYFKEFLGLPFSGAPTPASFAPLVRGIMTDAVVQAI